MTGVVFWAALAAVVVVLVVVAVVEFRQWRFERRYPTTLNVADGRGFPGEFPFYVTIQTPGYTPGEGTVGSLGEVVQVVGRDRSGAWRIERREAGRG